MTKNDRYFTFILHFFHFLPLAQLNNKSFGKFHQQKSHIFSEKTFQNPLTLTLTLGLYCHRKVPLGVHANLMQRRKKL